MPPLDFPPSSSSPYSGSNGVTYVHDGQKWVVSGSGTGPYLLLAGGSMTGPITLAADPTTSPQASTKRYVDNAINLAGNYLGTWAVASNSPNISAGGSISNANYVATTVNPATPETVPVGVPGIAGMTVNNGDRIIWASGLGVWQILRNAGVTLAAADARYYAISNPSGYQTAAQVTAAIGTPVASFNARTGAVTLSSGDVTTALTFTPYNATNPSGYQTAANVTTALAPYAPLASPSLTGNPTAPTPTAGDNDTSIATTAFVQTAVAPAANNAGRNLVHNPLMTVAQRSVGPFTINGAYTIDRWVLTLTTDSASITQLAAVDADRTQTGDEAVAFYLRNVFTGNAAAGAFNSVSQWIEGVRRLGGKTVTVSFYAGCVSGALKLGVSLDQFFGTVGGGGSAQVNGTGQSVTLTTSWARYSLTFNIASTAGKTLSSSASDATGLNFWFSSGATNATRAGSVGVQSGTIYLWGVQLEIGSTATALEKPEPQQSLSNAQRFYWTASIYVSPTADGSGTELIFPTTMRAAPTVAGGGAGFAAGALSAIACNVSQTAGGPQTLTFTADL